MSDPKSKERLALEELRSRLESMDGVTVYMGKSIDPAHDPLPAVTVVVSEPFEMFDNQVKGRLRWRGMLDIQGDIESPGADPIIELMDFADRIRKAVYSPTDTTMGRIVTEHHPASTHPLVPGPGETIGAVLIRLHVEYTEDYSDE